MSLLAEPRAGLGRAALSVGAGTSGVSRWHPERDRRPEGDHTWSQHLEPGGKEGGREGQVAEAERATFVLLERRRVDAPLRGVGRGHRSEPAPGSGRWSGTAGGVPDVVGSPPRTHPGPQSPSWTPGDSHENSLHGGLWRFPLIEERKFRNTSGWGQEFRADREIRAETRDLRKQKSGVTGGENGGRRGDWSPGSMKGRRSQ